MRCYPVWNIRHEGDYASVVEVLLASRGLDAAGLEAGAEALHAPGLLADMERALERLARAVRTREHIVVFGDYDVDGVTGTALLLDFLARVGADAGHLLPERHAQGYGLQPASVELARQQGARLIVTVDNGVAAGDAVALAVAGGIDVIVLDHHQQLGPLPPAAAIVNPNRRDSSYPFAGLAGVGVAFKFVQEASALFLDAGERRRYLNGLLDLVALGTVADMVPVTGENRVLVRRGLQILNSAPRPGLQRLLASAGYDGRPIDATGIAFHLAPRLNVAGRLHTPELALRLLRTQDAREAEALARQLSELNSRRQALQREGLAEAERLLNPEDLDSDRMVLLLGESWHPGVIGLLASKLSEKYARPAVVCTAERRDGTYTGSARSIAAYDISAALGTCADLLLRYGGHPAAAGFTLAEERFEEFRVRLLEHARQHLAPLDLRPCLEVDLVLRPADISAATWAAVEQLAPFGPGNPRPVFAARECRIAQAQAIGRQGRHLRLELSCGEQPCRAVWWERGALAPQLRAGARVAVAFALEADVYGGTRNVRLELQDMYPVG